MRDLWKNFKDEPDAVEKLSGFANCSTPAAREMIRRFENDSAAARRAAEEEENRAKAKKTSAAKKKPPAKKADHTPVSVSDFPLDSIVAAAVNAKHGLTIVEAEGHGTSRSVIVERVFVSGQRYHRVKVTRYLYYATRDEAIQAANGHGVKIKVF